MLKFFKKNKTLKIILILTIISFIAGILFNAMLDTASKKEITNNINNLLKNIANYSLNSKNIIKTIINNFSLVLVIWLLGISIIGIPFILFFYLFRIFMFSFEIVSLFSNLGFNNFLFIVIYIIPSLLIICLHFILSYYSISYSIVLSKMIFLKDNYNLKTITKKYIKILLLSIFFILLISIIETLIIPKILHFLI